MKTVWKVIVAFFFKRKKLFTLTREVKEVISSLHDAHDEESENGKKITKTELVNILDEAQDVLVAVKELLL